jgi:geranylgeranyl diphosphate synthase type I
VEDKRGQDDTKHHASPIAGKRRSQGVCFVADTESLVQMADVEAVLARYRTLLSNGLRDAVEDAHASAPSDPAVATLLDTFQGQMEYHLGWRHPDLSRARRHPGKLLRPALVLLACELAAGREGADMAERTALVKRTVPAAVCVELVHNFSLIHDDIEDGDEKRRDRPTLWKLWGVPQAINTGDGMFAMARMGLWRMVERGVAPAVVVRLAALLDRTCLELCQGQYLDMSYEGRRDVTAAMYLDMIGRKTAALMECSAAMGAIVGAPDDAQASARLAEFGRALGIAFQLRDDLLGIWANEQELGKVAAGDLRRKKMSLPIIHALETANGPDLATLADIYAAEGGATDEQIRAALGILERTGAKQRVQQALREQGQRARAALAAAAGDAKDARDARDALGTLVDFVLSASA